MYPSLQNKIVVMTGATGGLGPAVVHRFHAEGAKLALVDYTADKLPQMFGDLSDVIFVNSINITDEGSVRYMAETIQAHYPQVDVLINIAGGYRAGKPLVDTDLDMWEFMMNLNAKSVFLITRAIVPLLRTGGAIINIGAMNGIKGTKNSAAYGASKAVVFRLTESLAEELADQGIRVNAVYPRIIDTPANRADMPKADYSKWVTAESMAGILAFLASDEARDITGALIPVHGG
jgi:NAD(P)-dependent dehydrogenase (short-subunit alcohol dehydrogenase family)